jgi:hypothetical protein
MATSQDLFLAVLSMDVYNANIATNQTAEIQPYPVFNLTSISSSGAIGEAQRGLCRRHTGSWDDRRPVFTSVEYGRSSDAAAYLETAVMANAEALEFIPQPSVAAPARAQSSSSCAVPPPTPQAPTNMPLRKIGTAP